MSLKRHKFWLMTRKRLFGLLCVKSTSDVCHGVTASLSIEEIKQSSAFEAHEADWEPYEPIVDLSDKQARLAIEQTGLSDARDSDVGFIRRAAAAGLELRKVGTQLNGKRLKELGLRANLIMTSEFLEVLNENGRAEPLAASQFLMSAYRGRIASLNNIGRARHAGIKKVRVIPNNMASGSCDACLSLSRQDLPLEQAPIGPLPNCPHPNQCSIKFRAMAK